MKIIEFFDILVFSVGMAVVISSLVYLFANILIAEKSRSAMQIVQSVCYKDKGCSVLIDNGIGTRKWIWIPTWEQR